MPAFRRVEPRSHGQRLVQREGREPGGGEQLVEPVPVARLGIQTRHGGAHKVSHTRSFYRMPLPGMASYALTKSALQGMARGLARDFGPSGITINFVQPGPTDTDAKPADGPNKELMHRFMAIKRHGRPEEVAGMAAWLAGPEASFVTGAMHKIDGASGF